MIKIATTTESVIVRSPYNPDFVRDARPLGGKWDASGKVWVFPIGRESYVRDLCQRVYGTDGTARTVTLRVTIEKGYYINEHRGAIYLAGRQIARAFGRDSGAKAGDGVVFVSGCPDSGGSMKNWTTIIDGPAIFDVLDVPEPAARKEIAEWKSFQGKVFSIVGEEASSAHGDNVVALKAI